MRILKIALNVVLNLIIYYVIMAFTHFVVFFIKSYDIDGFSFFFSQLWRSIKGWFYTPLGVLGFFPSFSWAYKNTAGYIVFLFTILVPILMLCFYYRQKIILSFKSYTAKKKSSSNKSRIAALEKELAELKGKVSE